MEAGTWVLVSALGWVVSEAVVSGWLGERGVVGTVVLAGRAELVTPEVTVSGSSGEMVLTGTAELASAPGRVAVEGVVSDPLGETSGGVLGAAGLVSAGWMTPEAAVAGSPGEAVRVGAVELATAPG